MRSCAVFKRFRKFVASIRPLRPLARLWLRLVNRRRGRYQNLDYILLALPPSMPALPESRGWLRRKVLGAPPVSLMDIDRIFRRIGDDPRPKGVILNINGLALSLADLQTLRASIARLRAKGKRIVCFAQQYGMGQYYVACAADEIILQPGGELATTGLREEAVFLKDALDAVGIELDVVAISPYKGAYDRLSRSTISPEGREQLEWLLDSRYQMLLNGFARGRGWTAEQAQQMVDTAPHLDTDALAQGYIDGVMNEEGLSAHLGTTHLVTWGRAARMLFVTPRKPAEKVVALLPVTGLMMSGESGKPPGGIPIPIPFVGGERAGDRTVVRQVRHLMKRDDVAAVILYVDSGGGLATAAEAMTSALDELAKSRPVVVCMNAVAASGGYYIATPAQWIIAQPGTITGSIGVVTAKPVTGGLMERLRTHTMEFSRGANATLYSEREPFTDAQRAIVRRSIEHIYGQFVRRVATSRRMTDSAVDAVGGGRVWTGAQALALGLVDELGDLHTALAKARALASLPDDAPLVIIERKGSPLPPQLAAEVNPAATLKYVVENVRGLAHGAALLNPIEWT